MPAGNCSIRCTRSALQLVASGPLNQAIVESIVPKRSLPVLMLAAALLFSAPAARAQTAAPVLKLDPAGSRPMALQQNPQVQIAALNRRRARKTDHGPLATAAPGRPAGV